MWRRVFGRFRICLAGMLLIPFCAFGQSQTFSKEQVEQLVAPIALYPDSLLAQVLMAATYPLVRQGALKALGVSLKDGTSLARDIAPFARTPGFEGFDAGAWVGLVARAGTPAPIADRLAREIETGMADPTVRGRFESIFVEPFARGCVPQRGPARGVPQRRDHALPAPGERERCGAPDPRARARDEDDSAQCTGTAKGWSASSSCSSSITLPSGSRP